MNCVLQKTPEMIYIRFYTPSCFLKFCLKKRTSTHVQRADPRSQIYCVATNDGANSRLAVAHNRIEVVRLLLDKGAPVD